jgi:hypothetical protein
MDRKILPLGLLSFFKNTFHHPIYYTIEQYRTTRKRLKFDKKNSL